VGSSMPLHRCETSETRRWMKLREGAVSHPKHSAVMSQNKCPTCSMP
jgi:hypothetical protein